MRNENRCVSVYVPDSLENNNVGFLPGFIRKDGPDVNFYITDNRLRDVRTGCIGYCGLADMESSDDRPTYWIRVSFSDGQFQVSHILCDGVQEYKILYVFYDFKSFKNSSLILSSQKNRDDFFYLAKSLVHGNQRTTSHIAKNHSILFKIINWLLTISSMTCSSAKQRFNFLTYSSTFLHIETNLQHARYLLECTSLPHGRAQPLRARNLLVSKLLDLLIGLLILHWLLQGQGQDGLVRPVTERTQKIISQIAQLLEFLMGSPVGLKLNNAFNKALGNFFLYHMSLWNTFLMATSPLLATVGRIACCFAAFGFTHQLALIADLFAVATFHVYCIYVYAARLYGVQLHGLIALWRLFLGRKQNPLKCRVDTYHYNSHQLFVGTLAFSLLLFLLPTTALYYAVFVTLRLTLLFVSQLLDGLRRALQELPVYVTFLWLAGAPSVQGDVHVAVRPTGGALTVHATVHPGSWRACYDAAKLPQQNTSPTHMPILPTILYGQLI